MKAVLRLTLAIFILTTTCGIVFAQDFPAAILNAIPHAAEDLSSEDVKVRASILNELVVQVPTGCMPDTKLAFALIRKTMSS
jgi:hypothetical protein